MSDYLRSIIRTVLPGAWSVLVLWAARTFVLPQSWVDWLSSSAVAEKVTDVVALLVVYAFVRWVEPKIPDWLTKVLLGSAKAPTYGPTPS